jgi:hypothetical protein
MTLQRFPIIFGAKIDMIYKYESEDKFKKVLVTSESLNLFWVLIRCKIWIVYIKLSKESRHTKTNSEHGIIFNTKYFGSYLHCLRTCGSQSWSLVSSVWQMSLLICTHIWHIQYISTKLTYNSTLRELWWCYRQKHKNSAEDCTLLQVGDNSKTDEINDSYNLQRTPLDIYQLLDRHNSADPS